MDIRAVINDIEDRNEHPAKFILVNDDSSLTSFDIKVKVRGNMRSNPNICKFPPLRLNFKKKQTRNTLFDGQDKLKLVSHCNNINQNERYVLHEYLVYKHYNLLTEASFRVRLLKMTYKDTEGRVKDINRYGFIIEDEDIMARRNNARIYKKKLYHHDMCHKPALDIMMVFQYMIGNTDWSIPVLHNIKLIVGKEKLPIPVPYDFDYSGLINTHYSTPAPELPIKSVTERYFLGFCRKPGVYDQIFDQFVALKEDFYQLYENSGLLDNRQAKNTIRYFNQFYKIIKDPKLSKNRIKRVCKVKHEHFYNLD